MRQIISVMTFIAGALLLVSCSSSKDKENIVRDPESFSISTSLSNLDITSFIEDGYGHVWIATERGLNKYTGQEFYQYFRGNDVNTIANDKTYGIIRTRNNRLWIPTASGPCYYTENDDFHRVEVDEIVGRRSAYRIIELESGDIIMSNLYGEVFKYSEQDDRFWRIGDKDNFPASTSIFPSEGSSFWMRSQTMLHRADCDGMSMVVDYPYPRGFIATGSVMDEYNHLWIYNEKEILCFDTKVKTFVNLPTEIQKWVGEHSVASIHQAGKYLILRDESCWFYNLENGDIISQYDSDSPYSLPDFRPTVFYMDSNANLWVGSTGHGFKICTGHDGIFNRNHNLTEAFANVNVKSLDRDSNDCLWVVATENRIFRSDMDGNILKIDSRKFVSGTDVSSSLSLIKYDPFLNRIWVGMSGKMFLCRYSEDDLIIEKTIAINGIPNSMAIDGSGRAFIGTDTGYFVRIDCKDNSLKVSSQHNLRNIRDVSFVSDNRLMILSMMDDIKFYDVSTSETETLVYRDQLGELFHLLDGCRDRFGNLWFATQDYGLVRYTQFDGKFSIIPGTTCKTIAAVEVTDDDRLWVSSSFGMNMLSLESDNVVRFYEPDGIGGNQFNIRASCKLSDGTVVFGGTHGITTCNRPSSSIRNDIPIYFESLQVNGERTFPQEEGHYSGLLCDSPKIVLSHKDNNISVSFDMLDYSMIQTLQYQYKMEGYDKYWTFLGNDNTAHYSSLPAGRYTLKVSGKSIGNEPVYASLKIRVKPFVLTSPGAYIVYIILMALSAFVLIRGQRRRLALRMQLVQSEREREHEKHVNNVNMNFFADMAHEFRSPLTMIQGPMKQLLEDKSIGGDRYKLVSVMNLSVERMMKLVNQLLDFNKLDNDSLSLSVTRNTDIVAMLTKVVEMASVSAARKGIEVRTFGMDSEFLMPLDSEKFESIMSNLMSNALKYAGKDGETGHVEIHFNASNGRVRVMIDNNSPLLTEEELLRIFDRYYQVSEHAKKSKLPGTGIGLNFAHMLAKRMYGDLSAQNLPDGSGVRFILELPYDESVFSNEDFSDESSSRLAGRSGDLEKMQEDEGAFEDTESDAPKQNTILVVDDDVDIANYISIFLSPYYNVICAYDVDSAMKYVYSEDMPDVILSDVIMPGTDGISFCQSIKSNILTCHIPVILVTAKVGVKNEIQGLESGADAYVTKPFDPSYILALIKSMLKNRSLLKGELAKSTSVAEVQSTLLSKQDSEFLDRLYKIMEKEMSNPDLDVQNICDKMFVSRTKLFYKVKSLTGMSVTNLFKTFRLNMAVKLLKEGNDNIADVAYKVGFNTPSYFTKVFKSHFGVLPKDFVKN